MAMLSSSNMQSLSASHLGCWKAMGQTVVYGMPTSYQVTENINCRNPYPLRNMRSTHYGSAAGDLPSANVPYSKKHQNPINMSQSLTINGAPSLGCVSSESCTRPVQDLHSNGEDRQGAWMQGGFCSVHHTSYKLLCGTGPGIG
jgi:hypothetical protein